MNRAALADRFVSYADAISVFPFVQAVAYSIALSDPDIRCSIAEIWLNVMLGNIIFSILAFGVIVMFRRSEMALRQIEAEDALVLRYLRRLYLGRLVLVVMSCFYVAFSTYTATLDPLCSAVS